MATFKKWTSTVLVNGQPEPNVRVFVFSPGSTDQIPIYEDEGVTPITQPILTDSQGRYAFFVDVDTYPEIRLYLEKDGVDFSEANEDLDGVPVPGAGAGAGTFLELTDTPSSYVGRGGDVVLVKTTEDGIETQPWPVTGTILNFFLSDDAADIGSYYYMYPIESGDGYSELTSPSLSTGDDQLLWAFVTEAGEPGVEVLALGAYTTTLFLQKTGNKDVRVYWKLFKRDTGGTETEILQSAVSDYLTTDNSQYLISAYLNEDQTLDPTDRLVLKLFANVSGTGTDVTVTLTMEGDYDSRLTINVLSSAFNLDRLSDVTISSPADDELLAYNAGSGKWINQTPGEAGILAADGSVPLAGDFNADGHSINNVLGLNSGEVWAEEFPGADIGAKINAAISYLETNYGGGIIHLPSGSHVFSTPIDFDANLTNPRTPITLQGAGAGFQENADRGTKLHYTGSGYAIRLFSQWNKILKGFHLCGDDASTITSGRHGILIDSDNTPSSMYITLQDIWLTAFDTAIRLGTSGTTGYQADAVVIDNVKIYFCNDGIWINSNNSGDRSVARNVNFYHVTRCFHLQNIGFFKIDTCSGGTYPSDTGDNSFIYVDGTSAVSLLVENCQAESSTTEKYFYRQVSGWGAYTRVHFLDCIIDEDLYLGPVDGTTTTRYLFTGCRLPAITVEVNGSDVRLLDIMGYRNGTTFNLNGFATGLHDIHPTNVNVTINKNGSRAVYYADGEHLYGSVTWDPGEIPSGASATTSFTLKRAALGQVVLVAPGVDTQGLVPFGYVSAPDTVTIGLINNTGTTVNLGSSTWNVRVLRP